MMSRVVKVAVVQPSLSIDSTMPDNAHEFAVELLVEAAKDGADIICLPEYLNCMSCNPNDVDERAGSFAQKLLNQIDLLLELFHLNLL